MKINFCRPDKRTLVVLVAILFLSLFLRSIPFLIYPSNYPMGADAGDYLSGLVQFSKSWPSIPESNMLWGNIDENWQDPLVYWILGTLVGLLGVDPYSLLRVFPLVLYLLITLVMYVIGNEISGNKKIGLLSAFFFAVSQYDLLYTSNTCILKTQLSLFFIPLLFFAVLRFLKSVSFTKRVTHFLLAIATLSLLIITHTTLSSWLAIFTIVLFLLCVVVLDLFKRRFLVTDTVLILGLLLVSGVIVLPIYNWVDVILQNVSRVSSSSSFLYFNPDRKELMLHVLTNFNVSFLSFGIIQIILSFIGLYPTVIRVLKRRKEYVLLLCWYAVSMFTSNAFLFGIYFYPHRFMSYVPQPMAILAAFGFCLLLDNSEKIKSSLTNTKTLFGRINFALSRKIHFKAFFRRLLILLVLIISLVAAIVTITWSPFCNVYLTPEHEQALLWIKENTPEDSVIFASVYDSSGPYLPGIAQRTLIRTTNPRLAPGDYKMYLITLDANAVIDSGDIIQAYDVLSKYNNSYVYLSSSLNSNFNKISKYFTLEFVNDKVKIFKPLSCVYLNETNGYEFHMCNGGNAGLYRYSSANYSKVMMNFELQILDNSQWVLDFSNTTQTIYPDDLLKADDGLVSYVGTVKDILYETNFLFDDGSININSQIITDKPLQQARVKLILDSSLESVTVGNTTYPKSYFTSSVLYLIRNGLETVSFENILFDGDDGAIQIFLDNPSYDTVYVSYKENSDSLFIIFSCQETFSNLSNIKILPDFN